MAASYENSGPGFQEHKIKLEDKGSYSYAVISGKKQDVPQVADSPAYVSMSKEAENNPPPPLLSGHPSMHGHYQTPTSNQKVDAYESMEQFYRGPGSPTDSEGPLVRSEPIPEEPPKLPPAIVRKENTNPTYSHRRHNSSSETKRVFGEATEEDISKFEFKANQRGNLKRLLLVVGLVILFFMSVIALVLSLLLLFGIIGPSGCQCSNSDALSADVLQVVRRELIEDMNSMNDTLMRLKEGLRGPRGYNGSKGDKGDVGPPGPPMSVENITRPTAAMMDISENCINVRRTCPLSSDSSECYTQLVQGPQENKDVLSYYCLVKHKSGTGGINVHKANIFIHNEAGILWHSCQCNATLEAGVTAECQYVRKDCSLDAINASLIYSN